MANSSYTIIEQLDVLIKAVQHYLGELNTNKRILINAASACDAAMGSDDIAKKHIERLKDALEELEKTSVLAEEVANALIQDRKEQIMILEEN